jgi:hypothetical protein
MSLGTNFFVYDSSSSSYIDLSNILQGYKNGPTSSTNMYFGSIDLGSIFQVYNGTSIQANSTRLYRNNIDLSTLFNKYGTVINNTTLNTITGFTPGVGYMSTIINGIYIIGFFNQYDYYLQDIIGTFTPLNDINDATVIVVGGGGGGGDNYSSGVNSNYGGGGGSGGNVYIASNIWFNKNTTYNLQIGCGGGGGFSNSTVYKNTTYPAAVEYRNSNGRMGGNSYIGSYYAFGGAGGIGSTSSASGSGGIAGTGGGNGGSGGTPNNSGGNGSSGTNVVIASTTYYFGGGGVGGNGSPSGVSVPTSGLGGGGMQNASNNNQLYNGLFNIKYNTPNGGGGMGLAFTGGGGQGAHGGSGQYNYGFPGGSGCVLIAYPVNAIFPVITTDVSYSTCFLNGNILLTITNTINSSGTISFNTDIKLYSYLVVSGGNAGSNAGDNGANANGSSGGPGGLGGSVMISSTTYTISANTNINVSVGLGGTRSSPSTSSISCSSPSFSTTRTTGTTFGKLSVNDFDPANRGFTGTLWSITNLYYGGGGGPGGTQTVGGGAYPGGSGGAGGGGGGGGGFNCDNGAAWPGGFGTDQNGNRIILNSNASNNTLLYPISQVQGAYITRSGAGGGGGGAYNGGFPSNTNICSGGTGYNSIYSAELKTPTGYGSAGTYGKVNTSTSNGYSGGGGGGAQNTGGGGGGGGGITKGTNNIFAKGGGGGSGVIILYFSVI